MQLAHLSLPEKRLGTPRNPKSRTSSMLTQASGKLSAKKPDTSPLLAMCTMPNNWDTAVLRLACALKVTPIGARTIHAIKGALSLSLSLLLSP